MTDDERDWYEERAAIMQYDAGMLRAEAERKAAELLERRKCGSKRPEDDAQAGPCGRLPVSTVQDTQADLFESREGR